MKRVVLIILLALIFQSCDFFTSESAKKRVNSRTQEAEDILLKDYTISRDSFNLMYQKIINKRDDSLIVKQLSELYSVISGTLDYMDSLTVEIKKNEKVNSNNESTLNSMFFYNGIADSIFKKLSVSYTFSNSIAISDKAKQEVLRSRSNIINEPKVDEVKELYFGRKGAWEVNMILYSIKIDILKVVLVVLSEYDQQ